MHTKFIRNLIYIYYIHGDTIIYLCHTLVTAMQGKPIMGII